MSEGKPSLASSLDRYGEGVKWIVSLATGTVALGFGFFKDAPFDLPQQIALSVAAVFLFGAIVSGVLCGLHVVAFASHSEGFQRASDQRAAAESSGNHNGKREAEAILSKAKANLEKGRAGARLWWPVTLWTFGLGMFCFVVFGSLSIWTKADAPARPRFDKDVFAETDTGRTHLLLDSETGKFYRLAMTDSGAVRVTEVEVEPPR